MFHYVTPKREYSKKEKECLNELLATAPFYVSLKKKCN